MRKIYTLSVGAIAVIAVLLGLASPASADVIEQRGHRDNYYNISGDQLSSSSGAAYRVGVVIRTLGPAGGPVNQMDVNVCVEPLSGAIVRTSINQEQLLENDSLRNASNVGQIVNAPATNCADMDPNGNVSPSFNHTFLGAGIISIRRSDNILVTTNAVSNETVLPFT